MSEVPVRTDVGKNINRSAVARIIIKEFATSGHPVTEESVTTELIKRNAKLSYATLRKILQDTGHLPPSVPRVKKNQPNPNTLTAIVDSVTRLVDKLGVEQAKQVFDMVLVWKGRK